MYFGNMGRIGSPLRCVICATIRVPRDARDAPRESFGWAKKMR